MCVKCLESDRLTDVHHIHTYRQNRPKLQGTPLCGWSTSIKATEKDSDPGTPRKENWRKNVDCELQVQLVEDGGGNL